MPIIPAQDKAMVSNRLRANNQSPSWYSKHKYNCPQLCGALHTREDWGYLRADQNCPYKSTLPFCHYYAITTKTTITTINHDASTNNPVRTYSHKLRYIMQSLTVFAFELRGFTEEMVRLSCKHSD